MSRAESRPGTDSVRGKRSCGEPTPVWMTAKLDRGKRASSVEKEQKPIRMDKFLACRRKPEEVMGIGKRRKY